MTPPKRKDPAPDEPPVDIVEEADLESFPASDPPAWTGAIPSEAHGEPADDPSGD